VTDRRQAARPLADMLGAAFAAGCRWASLREKDLPASEQVALARDLRELAHGFGARLTLHGDPALACEAGLDGVHLSAGGDAEAARALLGQEALVGISIHAAQAARAADARHVNYAIVGPASPTKSKPGYGPALGPAGIAAMAATLRIPLIAIGGITARSAREFISAGAAGVAVMGGVMRSADPRAEVRALVGALAQAFR
jgi:thiamine-phosphate pyrophosphorylase